MAEVQQEVVVNAAAGATQTGEAAAANAKFSDQYMKESSNAKGPMASEDGSLTKDPIGMNKSRDLEKQGFPSGAQIMYDGPVAGWGNPKMSCDTTPTTQAVTPMPDGSVVITSSSTTVCRPNEHEGVNKLGPAGHGMGREGNNKSWPGAAFGEGSGGSAHSGAAGQSSEAYPDKLYKEPHPKD